MYSAVGLRIRNIVGEVLFGYYQIINHHHHLFV